MRKRLRKWLLVLFVIYITIGVAFYFLQDRVLFHPVSLKHSHRYDFTAPHTDTSIAVGNGDTLNLVRFHSTGAGVRGVMLYFHGNKKNISWYAKYTPYFTRHGYELLMIDYPGFGKSKGRFNEETLYAWALKVYELAAARFHPDSILIYGKSMGTGIAAQLASVRPCRMLILETPYYDFPSVVKHYMPIYPIGMMLHYKLPTHDYLPRVRAPIVIMHGTKDGVITYKNAKRLQPVLKPGDVFVTIDGGKHNNLYEFPQASHTIDSVMIQIARGH